VIAMQVGNSYAFKIDSSVAFTSVISWLGTGIFKKCPEIDRPLSTV